MPNITLTNLTSRDVFINFLYTSIRTGQSLQVYRSASDMMAQSSLHELVQNGTLSMDIDYTEEERESYFDIFPGFSLPEGPGAPPTHRRYVDINAPDDGDGSQLNPYQTIQVAVDDLEAVNDSLAKAIYIQPGLYPEAVVIRKDRISLLSVIPITYGDVTASVEIKPADDQWPLTLTNATLESLAAYDLSGDYGDLVNQGDAGPRFNSFMGLSFLSGTATVGVIRMLGVKGDASPDTTDFGTSLRMQNCRVSYFGSYAYAIYCKNVGGVVDWGSTLYGKLRWENSYRWWCHFGNMPETDIIYDDTDPHGASSRSSNLTGLLITQGSFEALTGKDSLFSHSASSGGLFFYSYNSTIGYRDSSNVANKRTITTVGNCLVRSWGSKFFSNLDFSGDTDVLAMVSDFDCNISLGSGPGTAELFGGGWSRELTDPDDKLVFTQPRKFTYPASATIAVTAVVGQRIRYNTSGGTFQIDAPASPVTGDSFAVKEIAGDATNVTVDGNGNNIEHPLTGTVAASAVFGQARIGVTWEFDGTDWIVP